MLQVAVHVDVNTKLHRTCLKNQESGPVFNEPSEMLNQFKCSLIGQYLSTLLYPILDIFQSLYLLVPLVVLNGIP